MKEIPPGIGHNQIKKPRTNTLLIRGFPCLSTDDSQSCFSSTETAMHFSDRSSDFRIVLPVAPSQPKRNLSDYAHPPHFIVKSEKTF